MNWMDHLNALMVGGGAVLLIVGLVVLRSSGLAEGTRLFAAQSAQRSLTSQLQTDLEHVGVGRPPGARSVLEATPERFAFHGVSDTLGTPALILYEVEPDGPGRSRVYRSVNGVRPGQGYPVTDFEVTPLDADGQPAVGLVGIRAIAVRAESDLPFEDAVQDVPLSWATVVRPIALQYRY